jgi:hypothetical protein
MTVAIETVKVELLGNGVTTSFPWAFNIPSADALTVYITTAAGVVSETTNYTATGFGSEAGGTVTYPSSGSPLANGAKLTIVRDTDIVQAVNLQSQTKFSAETVMRMVDKSTLIEQELAATLRRAPKVPVLSTALDLVMPPPTSPGSLLITRADSQGWEQGPLLDDVLDYNVNTNIVRLECDSFSQLATLFNYTGLSGRRLVAAGNYIWVKAVNSLYLVLASGASTFDFNYTGSGGIKVQVVAGAQGLNVKAFNAKGDDSTNDTAALQAAVNAADGEVFIGSGIFQFSALTVPRNIKITGASTRQTILKHTGAAAAITVSDASATEPDGSSAYIESGWAHFENLTLLVNGTSGFSTGNTRSSFTRLQNVYMRHRLDAGSYTVGSTAFLCDNTPWSSGESTYLCELNNVFIRGFETGVDLKDVVNGWALNRVYMIEVKNQINLSGANGIVIDNCYFESGIAAARGIVFGAGGGNAITVKSTAFELTNVAATQFAYDFTAGGSWSNINVFGAKYLLQGDGNAVNSKRITGTAPRGFLEVGRDYTSVDLAQDIPMIWSPGVSSTQPFQLPNWSRLGGAPGGNGRLRLGRAGQDNSDGWIENDGTYGINIVAPGSGSVVDWSVQGSDAATHLQYRGYGSGDGAGFYPGTDSNRTLGALAKRWSVVYGVEVRPGAGAVIWTSGAGTPEGVVTAPVGSLFTRTNGGAGTTLYVKESGSGNTGWVGK